jgi:hypothetical protein
MNIVEIAKKENVEKKYEGYNNGESNGIWTLKKEAKDIFELYNENMDGITDLYYVSEIANLEFKEVTDWSKVPVDTPIWVRENEEVDWIPRHFAKYEDGVVYVWGNGKTSFTTTSKYENFSCKYAKLYKE